MHFRTQPAGQPPFVAPEGDDGGVVAEVVFQHIGGIWTPQPVPKFLRCHVDAEKEPMQPGVGVPNALEQFPLTQ